MAREKLTSEEIIKFRNSLSEMTIDSLNEQMMRNGSVIRQADGEYDLPEVARYIHINDMIQFEINRRVINFMNRIDKIYKEQNLFYQCTTVQEVLKALENIGFKDDKALREAEVRIKEIQFEGRLLK